MAPPAPALLLPSQHTLYNAPASSAPSRAGVGCDLLPGFQLVIVYLGREYSKQEVLMFLFAYVKNEDFHIKDRNRVAFGPLPKSYSISLLHSALKWRSEPLLLHQTPILSILAHVLTFITVSGLITTVMRFTNIKDAVPSNKVKTVYKSFQE